MALSSPQQIAEKGEQIYKEKYQSEYEKNHLGKFVAIEIDSGEAFLADTPEQAIEAVERARNGRLFHLIKVGSPGVYRMSYTNAGRDWLA